jgi:lipopolysaccharide/colanic/teichoic acid biosynthesis glycosyltransferase
MPPLRGDAVAAEPPAPVPRTVAALPHRQDPWLRAADVVVAGTAAALTAPVMAVVALVIRLVDGAPVLYRGERLGRGGRPFVMYKFRTLRTGAEARLGGRYGDTLQAATAGETTRTGAVLRATQLDELPQLANVLRGDMSMVGPRPLRPAVWAQVAAGIPNLSDRFAVRPGLTGFAQVRQTNVTPWEEKLAHDLEYVADRSLGLYARCCAQTAARVGRQTLRGAWVVAARGLRGP